MKLWGVFLTLLFSISNVKAEDTEVCEFIDDLSPYQHEVAYQAYRLGSDYDLGITMVAIAWKESKLGKYKVRMGKTTNDQSFGIMHTVAKWKTKGMSSFERGRWVESMVINDQKSLNQGLKDILYWQSKSDNWLEGVAMYNGGFRPNYDYAKEVVNIVKRLKKCNLESL